jgi:hypothetical protein
MVARKAEEVVGFWIDFSLKQPEFSFLKVRKRDKLSDSNLFGFSS